MPKPIHAGGGQDGGDTGGAALQIAGFSPDTDIIGDGITSENNELVFSGTGDSSQTVYFYIDGVAIGEVVWSDQPNPDGSYDWTFALPEALAEGTYEITVGFETTSKNGKSTKTTFSDSYSLTIDQTVTGTIDDLSVDSGSDSTDWVTRDTSPVVSGTAEAGATVTLHVISAAGGWSVLAGQVVASDGNWALTATGLDGTTLADGDYELSVEIEDVAGNVTTLTQSLTIDTSTVQPTLTGDAVTDDTTPSFTGTAEANSTVEVFANGVSLGTTTAASDGTWTFNTPAEDALTTDGTHNFTAVATDAAGNTSAESAVFVMTLDTTAPDAPIILSVTDDDDPVTDAIAPNGTTNDTTPSLSGTAEANSTVEIFANGVSLGTTTAAGNGTWTFTTPAGAALTADGLYRFTAIATDGEGRTSGESTAFVVTLDTIAPDAPLIETVTDNHGSVTGSVAPNGTTNDITPSLSGTAEANSTVEIYTNGAFLGETTATDDGTWSFTTPGLTGDGTYSFTAIATDAAGNASAPSTPFEVTLDTTNPDAPRIDSVTDNHGSVTGSVAPGGTTDDATPGFAGTAEANSLVEVFADGVSLGTATADPDGAWSLADSTITLSDGTYAIAAVATDQAGNVSSTSAPLSITVDTTLVDPDPPPSDGTRRQPADPLYLSQWHLNMLDDQGDSEWAIEQIWSEYTGAGVSVGIYDDGVEYTHSDLDDNYDATRHLTYLGEILDAAPTTSEEGKHGTAVAGVIGAEANGEGSVGIAFDASLTGVNIFTGPANINEQNPDGYSAVADEQYRFDILNHSWGSLPVYLNDTLDAIVATLDGWQRATTEGRDGYGSIIVKAAGNSADSAHGDALNNSRFAIIVGGHDWEGDASWYTNRGPSLLVSAPTSGNTWDGDLRIITTDRQGGEGYAPGNYSATDQTGFGGTSSAAPAVSGVIALMLEANPELGWRDVQTILSYSAHGLGTYDGPLDNPFETIPVDEDGDGAVDYYETLPVEYDQWIYNGADNWNGGGLHYSGDYGYGGVDVYNAVRMAETWSLFGPAQTSTNEVVVEDIARVIVPDDPNDPYASLSYNAHNANGEPDTVSATWTYSGDPMTLEYVTFSLEIELVYMEGLTMTLSSPEGTTVTLMEPLLNDHSPFFTFFGIPWVTNWSWSFGLEAFRGEDPNGDWTLTLSEVNSTYDTENYPGYGEIEGGKVNWYEFDFYGAGASVDDVYHYTDEVFDALVDEPQRFVVSDDVGADWLSLAAMTGDLTVDLASDGTGSGDMAGFGRFLEIAAGTVIENVVTGDGADIVLGNDDANVLYGMRGADQLWAGDGDDFIVGGAGDDVLTGGAGNDTFAFDVGSGFDTITDFTAGAGTDDVLQLALGTSYVVSELDGNAWIDFGFGNGIVLTGVEATMLHDDDFAFV